MILETNNIATKRLDENFFSRAFRSAHAVGTSVSTGHGGARCRTVPNRGYRRHPGRRNLDAGQAKDTPSALDTPGKRARFNNLKSIAASPLGVLPAADDQGAYAPAAVALDLALKIDEVIKTVRPDGWRGVQAREQVIKAALYGVLQDKNEVERLFPIIKAQTEY